MLNKQTEEQTLRNLVTMMCSVIAALAIMSSGHTLAGNMPPLTDKVLLKITGDLEFPNAGDEVHLDMAMLQSLPVTSITTHSPWNEELQHFEGVRINVLLDAIGARSSQFIAKGLDGYRFKVSKLDLDRYPIIIAYRQNGRRISVRELGPLRIVMPFDDFPELLTQKNQSRSVWQLFSMELF